MNSYQKTGERGAHHKYMPLPKTPYNNLSALVDSAIDEQLQSISSYGQAKEGRRHETAASRVDELSEQEKLLRNTLAELQAIFDHTVMGIIQVQNNRINRINTIAERMFGYKSQELETHKWDDFHSAVFTDKEKECVTGNGRLFYLHKKNGQSFWARVLPVDITATVEESTILYFFEDVSRQREMLKKVKQLSQAVEQSSNSIIITDTSGKIEYVNKTFLEVTGYSAKEVLGQNPSVFKSGKTPESVYREMWLTIADGREWSGEFINKKKNGDIYEEHVVVSPLRNEEKEISHFIATKENISNLKKARLQAESANEAKSVFLANVSHEIRTPMNAIIGLSDLLLDTELGPEQKKHLKIVNKSAAHLLSIINDLLDYSKIEAKQLSLEEHPFQPSTVVTDVISTLSLQARNKGLDLIGRVTGDNEKECFFLGDSLRLQQVLLNLVGNAVKFTDQGRVIVKLKFRPPNTHGLYPVKFTVQDTGIGLSSEQCENIFKRFTQSNDSITRKYGGTGLGLAISSRLVQLMGDTIRVESSLGKGSTFSFTLLLKKSAEQQDSSHISKQALPIATKRLKILLVEDNEANQELACLLLKKQGHDVVIAEHGLTALQYLSEQKYDLILMDIQMPVMDGLTATRYIRQFEDGMTDNMPECISFSEQLSIRLRGQHSYIVATTANVTDADVQCCLDAGVDEYLSKPYKKEALHKILHRFCTSDVSNEKTEQVAMKVKTVSVKTIRENLKKSYDLEPEEIEKVIDMYSQSLRDNLHLLQRAITNRDGKDCRNLAHTLKGAFLNLGIQAQADSAALLEKESSREILDHHGVLAAQIIDELQPLIGKISVPRNVVK